MFLDYRVYKIMEDNMTAVASTFADATVEQDAPGKPHCTGKIQSIFLRIITLSKFEPAKRTEPIK